jgi:serine/threonine protein phosphatase PrpC
VFKISEDGTPTVEVPANQFYYKNVRKDHATYVCAPYSANYPDALASTRSIGDFNLNTFGVSEKPEIQSVNMNTVFEQMAGDESPIAAVVLCSDGIWDNWIYDHVQKFAMDDTCLNRIKSKPEDGAQDVANAFSVRNEHFARKNFGGNRDDQTCIIMYITPSI